MNTVFSRKAHPSARAVSVQQAALFDKHFRIDEASPTGLVWKVSNRGIARAKQREPGDCAGSVGANGVTRVGLNGQVWRCSTVLRAISALNDARGGV
ncbi:MAG: hypothetical protein [Bacteriophage sp.]|nr:MAG: hypothetical protein [Bacteriophage sp.]